MWALVESGSVSKTFTQPKQITLGDIQYPSNIFTLWTSSELEALGIYEIVVGFPVDVTNGFSAQAK